MTGTCHYSALQLNRTFTQWRGLARAITIRPVWRDNAPEENVIATTGVITFRGPAHVIDSQSPLFLQLMGQLEGLPAREALCDEFPHHYFSILDDVYATGIEMRVTTPLGVLWVFRSETDPDYVVAYYERQPAPPTPDQQRESPLYVPAEWSSTLQTEPS